MEKSPLKLFERIFRSKKEDAVFEQASIHGTLETNDKLHTLPYWVWGNPAEAANVIIVHHGGPGAYTEPSDIKPFVDDEILKDTAVVAYDQRLSGIENKKAGRHPSKYLGGSGDKPLDSHTPENLIEDVEALMKKVGLDPDKQNIIHAGASWGSILALLCAEKIPGAKGVILSSITLGETEEADERYRPGGVLAKARPVEYKRFINLIPEEYRNKPLGIPEYCNKAMNPSSNPDDYSSKKDLKRAQKHARDIAMAFGVLHKAAADPDGIGKFGILARMPTDVLIPIGRKMGMDPVLFAQIAMRYFATHLPKIATGEHSDNDTEKDKNSLLSGLGNTAMRDVVLRLHSGDQDPLTPIASSDELLKTALRHKLDVKRNIVSHGKHNRESESFQKALQETAREIIASINNRKPSQ